MDKTKIYVKRINEDYCEIVSKKEGEMTLAEWEVLMIDYCFKLVNDEFEPLLIVFEASKPIAIFKSHDVEKLLKEWNNREVDCSIKR